MYYIPCAIYSVSYAIDHIRAHDFWKLPFRIRLSGMLLRRGLEKWHCVPSHALHWIKLLNSSYP